MAGTLQLVKGSGIALQYTGPSAGSGGMYYTPLQLDRNALKPNSDGMTWTEYQPDGFQLYYGTTSSNGK